MENLLYINNDIEKSIQDDLQFYINIEKAHVKAHQSKSKTGKVIQVKDYSNKVMKKQQPVNNQQNAQPQEQQDQNNQQQKDQQIQNNSGTAELEKEKRHLDFMLSKYPDMVDKNKVMQRMKDIDKAINKVNTVIQDVKLSKHKSDVKQNNKDQSKQDKNDESQDYNKYKVHKGYLDFMRKEEANFSRKANGDSFSSVDTSEHNTTDLEKKYFSKLKVYDWDGGRVPNDNPEKTTKNYLLNTKKGLYFVDTQGLDYPRYIIRLKEGEQLLNEIGSKINDGKKEENKIPAIEKKNDQSKTSEPVYKDLKDMKKGDIFKHKGNDVKFKKAGTNYVLGLMRVDKDTVRNIKIYDGGKVKVGRLRNNDNSYKTGNSKLKKKNDVNNSSNKEKSNINFENKVTNNDAILSKNREDYINKNTILKQMIKDDKLKVSSGGDKKGQFLSFRMLGKSGVKMRIQERKVKADAGGGYGSKKVFIVDDGIREQEFNYDKGAMQYIAHIFTRKGN